MANGHGGYRRPANPAAVSGPAASPAGLMAAPVRTTAGKPSPPYPMQGTANRPSFGAPRRAHQSRRLQRRLAALPEVCQAAAVRYLRPWTPRPATLMSR